MPNLSLASLLGNYKIVPAINGRFSHSLPRIILLQPYCEVMKVCSLAFIIVSDVFFHPNTSFNGLAKIKYKKKCIYSVLSLIHSVSWIKIVKETRQHEPDSNPAYWN